jgi:hypothetical protein
MMVSGAAAHARYEGSGAGAGAAAPASTRRGALARAGGSTAGVVLSPRRDLATGFPFSSLRRSPMLVRCSQLARKPRRLPSRPGVEQGR